MWICYKSVAALLMAGLLCRCWCNSWDFGGGTACCAATHTRTRVDNVPAVVGD